MRPVEENADDRVSKLAHDIANMWDVIQVTAKNDPLRPRLLDGVRDLEAELALEVKTTDM